MIWEQHCCLPLIHAADISELARYHNPLGAYLSVNVGYSPQTRADSTAFATDFADRATSDGRFDTVRTVDDIVSAVANDKIALAFDLEDSGPLEGDLSNVAHFYDLGVRSLLPTYNHANAAGCGCLDSNDTGLTAYGRDLVREMNQVGMFVDGSHCSRQTGLDLAATSARPTIYSHSNFASLWAHPRNITDDQARACADTGGVVGINGVGIFLGVNGPGDDARRLEAMADQIEYGVNLLGISHVGVGSDYSFDHADFNLMLATNPEAFSAAYTSWGPLHWVPPEDTLTLDAVLRVRGHDDDAIAAVMGGNFMRIAREVWQ
ncbi:membrane dipeptidase [Antrihabitans stalactiti]|uniref:Membrane dipeptidase n=1 Tax=Antrihabitans stalactiti TaxID=2584121 RepID=A0A848KN18_9NOCA|nr:membrane dipeptidase [Antrihabitans stalactiti]